MSAVASDAYAATYYVVIIPTDDNNKSYCVKS